jgi:hypothetical protein
MGEGKRRSTLLDILAVYQVWDYHTFCWPSRVVLDWYRGRLYQGRWGTYRMDGPPVLESGKER